MAWEKGIANRAGHDNISLMSDRRSHGLISASRVAALLMLLIVSACAAPPPAEADARALVAEHVGSDVAVTVHFSGVGEGDSDHRYDHVRMRLLSPRALRVEGGLFAGLQLEPNVPKEVELIILYQWSKDRWYRGTAAMTPEPSQ
jgi:hypothetical protein